MEFEKWLMEMTKQIQQNPQNHFESSVEEFSKEIKTKFKQQADKVIEEQKKKIKSLDNKLKAFDSTSLSDDQRIERMKKVNEYVD